MDLGQYRSFRLTNSRFARNQGPALQITARCDYSGDPGTFQSPIRHPMLLTGEPSGGASLPSFLMEGNVFEANAGGVAADIGLFYCAQAGIHRNEFLENNRDTHFGALRVGVSPVKGFGSTRSSLLGKRKGKGCG